MSRHTILVIEDNPLNWELVRDLLEANKFIVVHAPNAKEGICMAREILPDLILMDFGLPDLDGLSATRQLKSDPVTFTIPVIGVTAHAMKGDEEQAMHAGCDGYMTKPIDIKTFGTTIAAILSGVSIKRNANHQG